MRKGEELKAPRYASAAATRDYMWYIPDNNKKQNIKKWLNSWRNVYKLVE